MATQQVVFIGTPEAVQAERLADALEVQHGRHFTIQEALVVIAFGKQAPPIVPVDRSANAG